MERPLALSDVAKRDKNVPVNNLSGVRIPVSPPASNKAPSLGAFLIWVIKTGLGYSGEEKFSLLAYCAVHAYSISEPAMTRHNLPDFASPSTEKLRELYRRSDDDLTRRTALEVIRLRDLVIEIGSFRESVEKAWKQRDMGNWLRFTSFAG
jgi:hypothetical protein